MINIKFILELRFLKGRFDVKVYVRYFILYVM